MATREQFSLNVLNGIAETIGEKIGSGGCLNCEVDLRKFDKACAVVGIDKDKVIAVANELVIKDYPDGPYPSLYKRPGPFGDIKGKFCGPSKGHLLIAATMVYYGLDPQMVRQAVASKNS